MPFVFTITTSPFAPYRWTPICQLFDEEHTGDQIEAVLEKMVMDTLKLDPDLPMWGVSDNAANMLRAMRLSRLETYACLCHRQQLGILDTFKIYRDILTDFTMLDVSDKCKRLAEHFRRSEPSRKLLQAECLEVGHNPNTFPQANDTRWDSRCSNMSGVVYHKDCLINLAKKGELVVKDKAL